MAGCKSADVTGEQSYAPVTGAKPTIIYVADFDLGVQNVQHEDGVLSGRLGPVGRVGERLSGGASDPAVRAQRLVGLMADSIVSDLNKRGFTATRLGSGKLSPAQGWLVHGVFAEVQEGNRLRRAMIGFGSGQTELQVIAGIDDLSQGTPKPLFEVDTRATSGKTPGGAPTLALGPYGVAARFVMAGKDLEKNVKQTATTITEQLVKRVTGGK